MCIYKPDSMEGQASSPQCEAEAGVDSGPGTHCRNSRPVSASIWQCDAATIQRTATIRAKIDFSARTGLQITWGHEAFKCFMEPWG